MNIYTRRTEPLTEREIAALRVHLRRGQLVQQALERQQLAAAKDLRRSTIEIKARREREAQEQIARERARQRLALPGDYIDYGRKIGEIE